MIPALEALYRPGAYFQSVSEDRTLLRNFLIAFALFLVAGMLLIFGTAWANQGAITAAGEQFLDQRSVDLTEDIGQLQYRIPWDTLWYPLYWFPVLGLVFLVRFVALAAFGTPRNAAPVLGISGHGVLPMIAFGVLIHVWNNLWPLSSLQEPTTAALVRLWAVTFIVLGGLGWEGWISMSGLRQRFDLGRGRAFVVWIAGWFMVPYAVFMFSWWLRG